MARSDRKARVRYDNGTESGREEYALEIWSDSDGMWNPMLTTRFVADAKHPETGNEFVHYSLVTAIIMLVSQGYSIDI